MDGMLRYVAPPLCLYPPLLSSLHLSLHLYSSHTYSYHRYRPFLSLYIVVSYYLFLSLYTILSLYTTATATTTTYFST